MNGKTTITLTAPAFWRLQWLCRRSPGEVSAMGLLADGPGLVIEDFILIRQEVSQAHVDLDMEHWADRQVELFDSRGIEPWRTSCWVHTHPAGLNRPSGVDETTMSESFGDWDLAVMLIMTRDGQFYGRMDIDHSFGGAESQRLSVPCTVAVDWAAAGGQAVTAETIASWESEFQDCVSESAESWLFDDVPGRKRRARSRQSGHGVQSRALPADFIQQEEVDDYVAICRGQGLDPDDPANYSDYFGYGAEPEVIFEG